MDVKRTMKNIELKLKEAAPDIMLVTGVALSAASIVMFVKKAKKAEPIVESYKNNIDSVADDHDHDCCDDKTYRKVVIGETVKVAGALSKVYWLPTLMWSASTGLIVGSHHILKDRAVTYAAIASGLGMELRNLHQRIIEKYGEDVDKELKYGTELLKSDDQSDQCEEDGDIAEAQQIMFTEPGGVSVFARWFDDSCPAWENDNDYVKAYVLAAEHDLNVLWNSLEKDEVLTFNDIYTKLTMKTNKLGQSWGYVKGSPLAPKYISLGVFNNCSQGQRDFVNGYQNVVLIDPPMGEPLSVSKKDIRKALSSRESVVNRLVELSNSRR